MTDANSENTSDAVRSRFPHGRNLRNIPRVPYAEYSSPTSETDSLEVDLTSTPVHYSDFPSVTAEMAKPKTDTVDVQLEFGEEGANDNFPDSWKQETEDRGPSQATGGDYETELHATLSPPSSPRHTKTDREPYRLPAPVRDDVPSHKTDARTAVFSRAESPEQKHKPRVVSQRYDTHHTHSQSATKQHISRKREKDASRSRDRGSHRRRASGSPYSRTRTPTCSPVRHSPRRSQHSQSVKHTFHAAPAEHPKFDGLQANLERWFKNAEDLAAQQGQRHNDHALIVNAKNLIHWEYKSSLAKYVYETEELDTCTSWAEFKRLFRDGCVQTSIDDLYEVGAALMGVRLQPDQSEAEFLIEVERKGRLFRDTFEGSSWSRRFRDGAGSLISKILKMTVILRDLDPAVKRRVVATHLDDRCTMPELRKRIIGAGGWPTRGRVRAAREASSPEGGAVGALSAQKGTSTRTMMCYRCEKTGHTAKFCRAPAPVNQERSTKDKADDNSTTSGEKKMWCHLHKSKGHNTRDCQALKKKKEEKKKGKAGETSTSSK